MTPVSAKTIVGKRISSARVLQKDELQVLGWELDTCGLVLELDDGTAILASSDPEMNASGAMVFIGPDDLHLLQV